MDIQFTLAEKAVEQLLQTWPGAPRVSVVPTAAHIPYQVDGDCRGLFVPRSNEVFVVADQPAARALDTVAHEVVAHFGLRAMLGRASWTSFMSAVQQGIRAGDWRLAEVRHQVRGVYSGPGDTHLRPILEADEVAAAVVEHHFRPETGRLRVKQPHRARFRHTLGHVHRELLYGDHPVDYDALLGALLASEHRLRHGGPAFGIWQKVGRWYASFMTKPWNPSERPMSLDESQRLLDAEDSRVSTATNFKLSMYLLLRVGLMVGALALGLAFFGGLLGNWAVIGVVGFLAIFSLTKK